MAFSLGGLSGGILTLLSSFLFWLVLIFLLLGGAFGALMIRKKRKLRFPVVELIPIGQRKLAFNSKSKCGWFKQKAALMGLLDYGGEDVLKLKDGRVVQNASSDDFTDINGKRGLIVFRSPEDPAVLLPISRMGAYGYKKVSKDGKINYRPVNALEFVGEIAPQEIRGFAVDILKQNEKEVTDRFEKIVQWVIFGGIIIFALISIILIVQMVKNGQQEAADLILEAGRIASSNSGTVVPSAAP